jgi:hypothetical protein
MRRAQDNDASEVTGGLGRLGGKGLSGMVAPWGDARTHAGAL